MVQNLSTNIITSLEAGTFEGAVAGLDIEKYHSLGLYYSSTQIKYLHSNSPKHFKAKYIDKILPQIYASEALRMGSAVHSMVLTPMAFDDEFYVMQKFDGRTKDGKEGRAAALLAAGSKILIDEVEHEKVSAIAVSALHHFGCELDDCKKEVSFFWKCDFSGLMFRGRFDAYDMNTNILYELKTCENASPDAFSRAAYNLGYDISLCHYEMGLRKLGLAVSARKFFCVEKSPPYVSVSYIVGDGFLETGHSRWLQAVGNLGKCVETGEWPGYVDEKVIGEMVLQPPSWAIRKQGVEDGI